MRVVTGFVCLILVTYLTQVRSGPLSDYQTQNSCPNECILLLIDLKENNADTSKLYDPRCGTCWSNVNGQKPSTKYVTKKCERSCVLDLLKMATGNPTIYKKSIKTCGVCWSSIYYSLEKSVLMNSKRIKSMIESLIRRFPVKHVIDSSEETSNDQSSYSSSTDEIVIDDRKNRKSKSAKKKGVFIEIHEKRKPEVESMESSDISDDSDNYKSKKRNSSGKKNNRHTIQINSDKKWGKNKMNRGKKDTKIDIHIQRADSSISDENTSSQSVERRHKFDTEHAITGDSLNYLFSGLIGNRKRYERTQNSDREISKKDGHWSSSELWNGGTRQVKTNFNSSHSASKNSYWQSNNGQNRINLPGLFPLYGRRELGSSGIHNRVNSSNSIHDDEFLSTNNEGFERGHRGNVEHQIQKTAIGYDSQGQGHQDSVHLLDSNHSNDRIIERIGNYGQGQSYQGGHEVVSNQSVLENESLVTSNDHHSEEYEEEKSGIDNGGQESEGQDSLFAVDSYHSNDQSIEIDNSPKGSNYVQGQSYQSGQAVVSNQSVIENESLITSNDHNSEVEHEEETSGIYNGGQESEGQDSLLTLDSNHSNDQSDETDHIPRVGNYGQGQSYQGGQAVEKSGIDNGGQKSGGQVNVLAVDSNHSNNQTFVIDDNENLSRSNSGQEKSQGGPMLIPNQSVLESESLIRRNDYNGEVEQSGIGKVGPEQGSQGSLLVVDSNHSNNQTIEIDHSANPGISNVGQEQSQHGGHVEVSRQNILENQSLATSKRNEGQVQQAISGQDVPENESLVTSNDQNSEVEYEEEESGIDNGGEGQGSQSSVLVEDSNHSNDETIEIDHSDNLALSNDAEEKSQQGGYAVTSGQEVVENESLLNNSEEDYEEEKSGIVDSGQESEGQDSLLVVDSNHSNDQSIDIDHSETPAVSSVDQGQSEPEGNVSVSSQDVLENESLVTRYEHIDDVAYEEENPVVDLVYSKQPNRIDSTQEYLTTTISNENTEGGHPGDLVPITSEESEGSSGIDTLSESNENGARLYDSHHSRIEEVFTHTSNENSKGGRPGEKLPHGIPSLVPFYPGEPVGVEKPHIETSGWNQDRAILGYSHEIIHEDFSWSISDEDSSHEDDGNDEYDDLIQFGEKLEEDLYWSQCRESGNDFSSDDDVICYCTSKNSGKVLDNMLDGAGFVPVNNIPRPPSSWWQFYPGFTRQLYPGLQYPNTRDQGHATIVIKIDEFPEIMLSELLLYQQYLVHIFGDNLFLNLTNTILTEASLVTKELHRFKSLKSCRLPHSRDEYHLLQNKVTMKTSRCIVNHIHRLIGLLLKIDSKIIQQNQFIISNLVKSFKILISKCGRRNNLNTVLLRQIKCGIIRKYNF